MKNILDVLNFDELTVDIYDLVLDIFAYRVGSNNSIDPLEEEKLVFDEP